MLLLTILLLVGAVVALMAITARAVATRRGPSVGERQQMLRNQTLFAQMRIAQATRLAVQQMNDLEREHLRQQQRYSD